MYTCSTDSVSHLRHWCSVMLNKFIIEIHTNKYMTSYHTLLCTAIIIHERVNIPWRWMDGSLNLFFRLEDTHFCQLFK